MNKIYFLAAVTLLTLSSCKKEVETSLQNNEDATSSQDKMIAAQLQISIDTVRFYIKQTYLKLQVNSAPEAIAKALREHII